MREAALKHDVAVTFMAKPITDQPGSAMHIHQSVVDIKTGKNLFSNADGTMSELFLHHIGGLQKFIPELLPLFAPNVNSFRRFLPDTSAPVNVEWGEENRTVGLRVPEASPQNRRVENRLAGADANPYLVLAASLLLRLHRHGRRHQAWRAGEGSWLRASQPALAGHHRKRSGAYGGLQGR